MLLYGMLCIQISGMLTLLTHIIKDIYDGQKYKELHEFLRAI